METTRRFLDSFMATKSILIRLVKDEAKYYKNKRLVVLSKKLEEIDKSGQESNIHFSIRGRRTQNKRRLDISLLELIYLSSSKRKK